MTNLIPLRMTYDDLADILQDMANRVRLGDSMEGNIEYSMRDLDQDGELDVSTVMVQGCYRIGNTMGQGGMRMLGLIPPPKTVTVPAGDRFIDVPAAPLRRT